MKQQTWLNKDEYSNQINKPPVVCCDEKTAEQFPNPSKPDVLLFIDSTGWIRITKSNINDKHQLSLPEDEMPENLMVYVGLSGLWYISQFQAAMLDISP